MKTYLPTDLINNDYSYYINDNYYIVYKGNDICTNVYPTLDYTITSDYTCSSIDGIELNINSFTDDFYYRQDIHKIFFIFLILFIFIIYLPYKVFSRIFGRWLKI